MRYTAANHRKLIASADRECSLDFLARMVVRFKSYSNTPHEFEPAHFMAQAMRALGLETELQSVEGSGTRLGRWRGGVKGLLFNGHMDTKPVTEG